MRKTILYIAMSLDGKIADTEGQVDWLENLPNPDQNDYGYANLLRRVDTTIMGNSTYQQVLGFPMPFPYGDKTNYVLTSRTDIASDEYATFVSADALCDLLRERKQQQGQDIWVIGGSQTIKLLLENQLIDELMLFVMPIILGDGVTLFSSISQTHNLKLTTTKAYESGAVMLQYRVE